MAEPRPSGVAMTMPTPVTSNEPTNRVLMSYRFRRGNQPSVQRLPRSMLRRNVMDSPSSEAMIARLIRSVERPAARKTRFTVFSRKWRRRLPLRSTPGAPPGTVGVPIAIGAPLVLGWHRTEQGGQTERWPPYSCSVGPGLAEALRRGLPGVDRLRPRGLRELDVVGFLHGRVACLAHVEVHEGLDRPVARGLGVVHVDVQIAGERIGTVLDRLPGVGHAAPALAVVDLDGLHLVLVLVGECKTHPAQGVLGLGDAVDDRVVVARGLVVLARGLRLLRGDPARLDPLLGRIAQRDLDEAVVRARFLTRSGDLELGLGELGRAPELGGEGLRFLPVVEPLGFGADQGVEVVEVQTTDLRVLGRDDREPVDTHLELGVGDAVGLACLLLL